jgi:tetratricopeptide (TPR) repeat protein
MLRRIKQKSNQQPNSDSAQAIPNFHSNEIATLSDADYEFLFAQLLEGVAHGWHQGRIAKFFQQLEERGRSKDWIAWLERFGQKTSAVSTPSMQQLGARMIRLGELTQSTPEVKSIGAVASRIGRQLFYGISGDLIWEYDGPDLISANVTPITAEQSSIPDPLTVSEAESDSSFAATATTSEVEANLDLADPSLILEEKSDSPATTATVNEEIQSLSVTEESILAPNNPNPITNVILEGGLDSSADSDENSSELSSSLTQSKQTPVLNPELAEEQKNPGGVPSIINLETEANSDFVAKSEDEVNNLTWQQFTNLLAGDNHLAQEVSQQLELTDSDPKTIVKAVIDRINPIEEQPPNQPDLELVEGWFNLGLKQATAGDLNGALTSWEKALEINPNLSAAWHNRGSALGRLRRYSEAVESFDQALVIEPNNYQAWNDRGHALYQLQKWEEAVASWDKAIEIIPGDYQFWYNRGCGLEKLQRLTESIASYEKALEIKPDFQEARSRYINLLTDNSNTN